MSKNSRKFFSDLSSRRQRALITIELAEEHHPHIDDDIAATVNDTNDNTEGGTTEDLLAQNDAVEGSLGEPDNFDTDNYSVMSVSFDERSDSSDDEELPLEFQIFSEEDQKAIEEFTRICLSLPDTTTNSLLKCLKQIKDPSILPSNVEGLYGEVPEIPKPASIQGGEFLYLGIRQNLNFIDTRQVPETLFVDISWDGVTLHKSSNTKMWPIVMSIHNMPTVNVMLIALFIGKKEKDENPANQFDPAEFFYLLVKELNEIYEDDCRVTIGKDKKIVNMSLRCLVADTPARNFAMGTNGHNGYNACTRCWQTGEYYKHRVVFSIDAQTARTDAEFRELVDIIHHKRVSPFIDLNYLKNNEIGFIRAFALDPMHLLDLGVTLKILRLLLESQFFNEEKANTIIAKLIQYFPSDFTRRPRLLDQLKKFKASELRAFALYIGIVLVVECCSERELVENFLEFSIGYRLLFSENNVVSDENIDLARELIGDFVEGVKELYGQENISFNMHGLLHVPDDVKTFGGAQNFTAYQFENYYQMLRKWIRKGGDYFSQIYKRWLFTRGQVIKKCPNKGNFGSHILKPNKKDGCVLLQNGSVFVITEKKITVTGFQYKGLQFATLENYFERPVLSSSFNIYLASDLTQTPVLIDINLVYKKMVMIPVDEKFVVIPIIHFN